MLEMVVFVLGNVGYEAATVAKILDDENLNRRRWVVFRIRIFEIQK